MDNSVLEALTPEARVLMPRANEFSRRLGRNYTGTEHVLCALIETGEGAAFDALASLHIDATLETVLGAIDELYGMEAKHPNASVREYTPDVYFALGAGVSLKRDGWGRPGFATPLCVLFGIAQTWECRGAKTLEYLGVDLGRLRERIRSMPTRG